MADCSHCPPQSAVSKARVLIFVGAEKWRNRVVDGIAVLKSFYKIIIHTRCKEMQQKSGLYSYKIDRMTKQVTTDIVDKFNHGWDAVRYALAKFIVRKAKGFFG